MTACATVSPVGVAERRREVHHVAHDGRVRGAEDRRRHLVGDRLRARSPTICCVIGSARRRATPQPSSAPARARASRSRRRAAPSSRAARRRSCRTRRRAAARPRLGADRGARAHRHVDRLGRRAEVGRVARRSRTSASATSSERRSRRGAEHREPQGADLDRRARLGRARRRAARARPRSARRSAASSAGRSGPAGQSTSMSQLWPAVAEVGGAQPLGRRGRRTRSASTASHLVEQRRDAARVDASASRWHERTSWNSGRAKSRPTALNSPASGGDERRSCTPSSSASPPA